MTRVRFKVDNRERLWTLSILSAEGVSLRDYIEILLTHLCAPYYEQPRVPCEVGTRKFIKGVRTPVDPSGAVDPDPGEVSISWPAELVAELEPALEAAGLDLPSLLSTLWAWAQCPDDQFSPALKARLDAFASGMIGQTGREAGAERWVEQLPWNDYKEDQHV